jgi:hypothetical protein
MNAGENYTVSGEYLASIRILSAAQAFLQTAGLPEDVAPWLTFSEVKKQSLLSPNKVFPIDYPELDRYLIIGFNGCGDPVCIYYPDTLNGLTNCTEKHYQMHICFDLYEVRNLTEEWIKHSFAKESTDIAACRTNFLF